MRIAIWLTVLLLLHVAEGFSQERLTFAQQEFFESKIRPVLVQHCYECHSQESDEPGGGLLLDSAAGLSQGGVSGPALVAGKPQSSLLLLAMQHKMDELQMPPQTAGGKLPDAVLVDFSRWIRSGAADPRGGPAAPEKDTDADASQAWWAWQTLRKPARPQVADKSWPRQELDYFVLAGLDQLGLQPSTAADRLTLVRRLALDLTGLPPTAADLQTFALSEHPGDWEELVDQYLSSQHYGERMARRWLDVARYAESSGKDINVAYPEAWRYRDYVIDAFNADLPFNQFIVEQLAGDLLPSGSDLERGRQTIATGFLALGAKGLNERNPLQFAIDVADEQIDAVSQAFLATTIACARCHDHKFDPITQRDYTALAGIFLSTETHYGTIGGVGAINRSSLVALPEEYAVARPTRPRSRIEVQRMQARLEQIQQDIQQYQRERSQGRPQVAGELLRLRQQAARLNVELEGLDEQGRSQPRAMAVSDKTVPPSRPFARFPRVRAAQPQTNLRLLGSLDSIVDSPLLIRGEIDQPSDIVPRGLPLFLAQSVETSIAADESGRLQLAEWIASDANALTARVIVNRVWTWTMGQGIVATVDNFGTSGDMPSNQALLDYLTAEFVESNWSIKALVRHIVLSNTYQQSSEIRDDCFQADPDNRYLWRANRKPLDAEALRDTLLAASGMLQVERPIGSIVAESGDGLIGLRRGLGLSETSIVAASPPYRSIYLPVPRGVLPESLELFDFSDNAAVDGFRELTIVPSQALYWMNSSQVEQQCAAVVRDLFATARRDTQNQTAYRLAPAAARQRTDQLFEALCLKLLSRPPLEEETQAMRDYVQEQRRNRTQPEVVWTAIARSLASSADYRLLR